MGKVQKNGNTLHAGPVEYTLKVESCNKAVSVRKSMEQGGTMWRSTFFSEARCLTIVAFCFLSFACAMSREASWKTVPETQIPYERAWAIVVNAVSQHYDLENSDGQSGYLRTSWKVTDSFLGTPLARSRVLVRVEERTPFKVKVKVEKQEPDPWNNNQWMLAGDDEPMAAEIMGELSGRLRSRK